jgi:aspartate kinase
MERTIVMKFGGTSVATPEKIKHVAKIVIGKKKEGYSPVVVVSAPGDTTDELIELAHKITETPDARELDVLLSTGEQVSISLLGIAIKSLGYDVISLTGPQAGIYTDKQYTNARIVKIKPKKIYEELKKGKIVIVAGFQGINPYDDITTLGRGGSDLTAVALAATLMRYPRKCEIYTDVVGVYTADPRIIKEAKKIDKISYDEMLELASSGAQVMQSRAIEVAKKYNVDIEVKSTFSDEKGTLITREGTGGTMKGKIEEPVITGISYDKNQVKFSITDVPDKPGVAARIFGELAKENVNVDMIIQSAARDKHNDISFTTSHGVFNKVLKILERIKTELGASGIIYDKDVCKVSIVGTGMRSYPGIAARMFRALAAQKINIEMISTSEIKISCVIRRKLLKKAVKALHREFFRV